MPRHLCLSMVAFSALAYTPSWRIRLKARVNLGDQTAEFMPFEVIRTAILTYFYLFFNLGYGLLTVGGVLRGFPYRLPN